MRTDKISARYCLSDIHAANRSQPSVSNSGVFQLDITTVHPSSNTGLSIEEAEPPESKIRRLISDHPVIVFTRSSSCCMCHVMKNLLAKVGVHPTVIELDDAEIGCLPFAAARVLPVVFVGGACVGGLESLVGLHLSGLLVPRLVEVGALWV